MTVNPGYLAAQGTMTVCEKNNDAVKVEQRGKKKKTKKKKKKEKKK